MGPLHWVRTLFRTNSPYHAPNGILTHFKNMATVSGALTVTSHVAVDVTSLEWRVSISTEIWSLTKRTNFMCFLLGNSPASEFYMPTFRNTLFDLHSGYPPMKVEQSVPKRWHIKFRRRGIIQKKAHNIQNTAKVWNQAKDEACGPLCSAHWREIFG